MAKKFRGRILAKALLDALPRSTSERVKKFLSKKEIKKIEDSPLLDRLNLSEVEEALSLALYEAFRKLFTHGLIELFLSLGGLAAGIAIYVAGKTTQRFSPMAWGAGQCFLLPVLLMANLPGGWHLWGLTKKKIWLYGFAGAVILLPGFLLVRATLGGTGEASFMALKILSGGIFGTLSEEVLFRRIIYGELSQILGKEMKPSLASLYSALTSALLFTLVHLGNELSLFYLGTVFVSGLILCYLYEKTGSLLTPWIAHTLVNVMNFLIIP